MPAGNPLPTDRVPLLQEISGGCLLSPIEIGRLTFLCGMASFSDKRSAEFLNERVGGRGARLVFPSNSGRILVAIWDTSALESCELAAC